MRTRRLTMEQGRRCHIERFPKVHTHREKHSFLIMTCGGYYYDLTTNTIEKPRRRPRKLLVCCGPYIYDVSSEPSIYQQAL